MVQESQQNKRCSAADLYVVPYGRYNLMESMPLSMMKHLEDDVPPVFMILDTFDKDIKVIFHPLKTFFFITFSFYFHLCFVPEFIIFNILDLGKNYIFFSSMLLSKVNHLLIVRV